MRKYLREIEISGVILAAIGIICALVWGTPYGMWPCGLGLLLLLVIFLYKAFHWKENDKMSNYISVAFLVLVGLSIFGL